MIPNDVYEKFILWYVNTTGDRVNPKTKFPNNVKLASSPEFQQFLSVSGNIAYSPSVSGGVIVGEEEKTPTQPTTPDETPTASGDNWRIVSREGWDILEVKDNNGNWMPMETLGRTQTTQEENISPYQQGQLDLEQERMRQQQEYNAQQLGLSREQLAFNKEQSLRQIRENEEQRKLEQQRQLAEYRGSPGDWVTAWEYERAIKPQPQQTNSMRGQVLDWIQALNVDKEMVLSGKVAPGSLISNADTTYPNDVSKQVEYIEKQIDTMEKWETQLAKEDAKNYQMATSGAMPPVEAPKNPPAPSGTQWINRLTPGWNVGQGIPQGSTRLASAQLWNTVPWSQREMLGGYLGSQYQRGIPSLRDYEEMIAQRLPNPSERTVRNRPAYQV